MSEEAIDLKEWTLVITESGKSWIGKQDGHIMESGELSPLTDALSVHQQLVQTPNGQTGWMRSLWPIEIAHGVPDLQVTEITVVPACKPQNLGELEGAAATEMRRMIAGALGMRQQARAARAGIVLPGIQRAQS